MTTNSRSQTLRESRHERQYWQRRSPPRPWWPWGILLPLALFFLWLYGATRTASHIQSDVQNQITQQLTASGFENPKVQVNGQFADIELSAMDSDKSYAYAVARATECSSWFGPLVCPTQVTLTVNPATTAVDVPVVVATEIPVYESSVSTRVATTSAPAPVAVEPTPNNFEFSSEGRRIQLTGAVPSEQARDTLVAQATRQFEEVVDKLEVTDSGATIGWTLAAERALALLNSARRGTANWLDGNLNANLLVDAADENRANRLFENSTNAPTLGTLTLQVAKTADSCNTAFADALTNNTINFRTSSAEINDSSADLLSELGRIAQQCAGNLVIEGHTDSLGEAAQNLALSLARANAVRKALVELGITANRLDVVGHGADQPVASNSTRAGRAQNRRIVISVSATASSAASAASESTTNSNEGSTP